MNTTVETESAKAEKLAHSVLDIMESLVAVMEEEIMTLGQGDYARMESVRCEKMKIVREYQSNMTSLVGEENRVNMLSPPVKAKLKNIGLKLAEVSKKNASVLSSAIQGTQAFLHTVMSAAQKKSRNMDSYDDPRKSRYLSGAYSPTANPVAVDRTA